MRSRCVISQGVLTLLRNCSRTTGLFRAGPADAVSSNTGLQVTGFPDSFALSLELGWGQEVAAVMLEAGKLDVPVT